MRLLALHQHMAACMTLPVRSWFPYALLEVKISAGETPEWVSGLLSAANCIQVHKFSKFLTGIVQLYPSEVTTCPHWFDNGRLLEPAALVTANEASQRAVKEPNRPAIAGDDVVAFDDDHDTSTVALDPRATSVVGGGSSHGGQLQQVDPLDTQSHWRLPDSPVVVNVITPSSDVGAPLKFTEVRETQQAPNGMKPTPESPKSLWFRKGKTAQVSPLPKTSRDAGVKPQEAKRSGLTPVPATSGKPNANGQAGPNHRRMVPVRIEPKTFFANERTWLNWMNQCVLLVTLAVALLSVSRSYPSAYPLAIAFSALALLFVLYAIGVFHWRGCMIRIRSAGGYDDRFGPTILSGCLLAILISTIIFSQPEPSVVSNPFKAALPFNTNAAAGCEPVLGRGVPSSITFPRSFTPTDAVYHSGRDVTVVSSQSWLALLSGANPFTTPLSASPPVLVPVSGSLIEGLAVASPATEFVYLSVSRVLGSAAATHLITEFSLATRDTTRSFDLSGVVDKGAGAMAGLAFQPDASDTQGGTFWVSGASALYRVRLHIATSSSSLAFEVVDMVNISPVFAHGLLTLPTPQTTVAELSVTTNPATSASTLYVTFAQVPVVRSFSLPALDYLGEWSIPGGAAGVAKGFNWTGVEVFDDFANGTSAYVTVALPSVAARLPFSTSAGFGTC